MSWLIYGAYGYTGELIAREAVRRGERPILAGRDAAKLEPLARELGCEVRVFGIDAIDLRDVSLVLHCAGPFSHTSAPMVSACLAAKAHYLDITGEIAVFESVFRRHDEAVRAGVTLLPGAGFDVVPTDCLAAMLARRLPDATELWLAFYPEGGSVSRGTMKTMLENIAQGGAVRRDGQIVRVPTAWDVRTINFSNGARLAVTIPWGDVSTAYHTTGIPNIRVYNVLPPGAIRNMRRFRWLLPLAGRGPIQWLLQRKADQRHGPSEARRQRARTYLWGRAFNERESIEQTMTTPEGYHFTMLSALAAVARILAEPVQAGAFTPAKRFGPDFVLTIPGVALT